MNRKRALARLVKQDAMTEKRRRELERSLDPDRYWRRQERRCFWRWPLGHVWQRATAGLRRTCLNCGREETYEYYGYDSGWERSRRDKAVPELLRERYALGFIDLDEFEQLVAGELHF